MLGREGTEPELHLKMLGSLGESPLIRSGLIDKTSSENRTLRCRLCEEFCLECDLSGDTKIPGGCLLSGREGAMDVGWGKTWLSALRGGVVGWALFSGADLKMLLNEVEKRLALSLSDCADWIPVLVLDLGKLSSMKLVTVPSPLLLCRDSDEKTADNVSEWGRYGSR